MENQKTVYVQPKNGQKTVYGQVGEGITLMDWIVHFQKKVLMEDQHCERCANSYQIDTIGVLLDEDLFRLWQREWRCEGSPIFAARLMKMHNLLIEAEGEGKSHGMINLESGFFRAYNEDAVEFAGPNGNVRFFLAAENDEKIK